MNWFGDSASRQEAQLERARREDQDESLLNLMQENAELKSRIEKMTVRLTEEGLSTLSVQVALLIEDQFAVGHEFGRGARFTKVAHIIRDALREISTGEKKWSDWQPGSVLKPPMTNQEEGKP